jgi:hypothetical protein
MTLLGNWNAAGDWLITAGGLLVISYGLVSGVFAMRFPDRLLKTSWTPTRGMTPNNKIRLFGLSEVIASLVVLSLRVWPLIR